MQIPYYTTTAALVALAAFSGGVSATVIPVAVGQSGLSFSPSSVMAQVGDVIEYQFFPPNHSVVMGGGLGSPCSPATTGGFFSGFFAGNTKNSMVFRVTVNTTDPIFFYCGFPSHCELGMVGVINPSGSQTLDAYMAAAKTASGTVVPNGVVGGQVVAAGSAGSSLTPPASTPSSGGGGGGGIYGGPSGNGAAALGVSLASIIMAAVLLV